MRSPRSARLALALLCLAAASVGIPATLAPHAFYADFPFFAHWVELLPPYNRHLVTDAGGLYLGFATVFAWGAVRPEPTLVRAACTGWLLAATLHLAFHATHLSDFGTADAVGEIASLALLLVPPPIALWSVRRR
jgi:hypothetical protein